MEPAYVLPPRSLVPSKASAEVTLYIAKAYHVLEEYDDCGAILSEAAAFWPFNLVVKLNQVRGLGRPGVAPLGTKDTDVKRQGKETGILPKGAIKKQFTL